MKALIAALSAGTTVLMMGTVAEATTFTLDSYTVNLNETDPGLVLDWAPLLSTPASATLGLGESISTNLFKVWTDETWVNNDDLVAQPISVDFNFSLPTAFGGSVTGETTGFRTFLGALQGGKLTWDGPSVFSFGNGGLLEVSLSDEFFNVGVFGLKSGERHGAKVSATFTLLSEHKDVPEPAMLMGLSLLGLGLLARRSWAGGYSD